MISERDTAGLFDDLGTECREAEAEAEKTAQAEAREELALFFTHSLDLQCVAGFDGYFKRLNPAWMVRLGWTVEKLMSRPFLDFVHPDDRDATLAEIDRIHQGQRTILFENRYRHWDGSYRWLQWNAWPVPGRQRIYATARDITRQKRLEREVLEILDCEKERLGRELHDGLCQTLAGIAALSTTLSRRLAEGSETTVSGAAAEIAQLLTGAIGEVRDLAHGFGPLDLEQVGLEGALETLALSVEKQFRVSCTLARDHSVPRLDYEIAVHLFRIVQEAVNNAVNHGRGDRIEIGLDSEEGRGVLSVRDNGVGIPCDSPDPHGVGMHTMAYRARRIGGLLEIRPRSPHGTTICCSFPLPRAPESGDRTEP